MNLLQTGRSGAASMAATVLKFDHDTDEKGSCDLFSLKPLGRRVIILAMHEAMLNPSRSRLNGNGSLTEPIGRVLIPDTAEIGQRWFGWVVGVGSAVHDLVFGDLVELPRDNGELWMRKPMSKLFGRYGETLYLCDAHDKTRRVEWLPAMSLAVMRPEHIIFRIASSRFMFHGEGEPGVYPIGDRVLVEEIMDGVDGVDGVDGSGRNRLMVVEDLDTAQGRVKRYRVLDVGSSVDSVMPGDEVMIGHSASSVVTMADGRLLMLAREGDIECLL